ncbi:MAG: extracellular solute-binding protein [Sphaerochaetaceae bacterium]
MKQILNKIVVTVALILIGTLLFAGGSKEKKGDEQVVEFWHSNSGLLGDATTTLVRQFNQGIGAEKGIVVKEVYQGKAADVATKLRAALQSGRAQNLPNLAQVDATGVMDVRDSHSVVSIQSLVDKDPEFSLDQLLPAAVLSMTYKSEMIGMPFNASTILLYYNKDAFQEVGLDPERPPQTLSELALYAAKLVKRSADGKVERYGFAGVPTSYELVSWIGQQKGLSYLTDKLNGHEGNPTKVLFDSEGTLAAFFKQVARSLRLRGAGQCYFRCETTFFGTKNGYVCHFHQFSFHCS